MTLIECVLSMTLIECVLSMTLIECVLSMSLTKSGFRTSDVQFIPCSAFKGENLVTISDTALSSWYQVKIELKINKIHKISSLSLIRP